MKKEKVQNTSEKRSVNDFEHRMTIQLTEQHYIDYARAASGPSCGRCCSPLWAVWPSTAAPLWRDGCRKSTWWPAC